MLHGPEPGVALDPVSRVHERLRGVHEIDDILERTLFIHNIEVLMHKHAWVSNGSELAHICPHLTSPFRNPERPLERLVEVFEVLDERCRIDVVPVQRDKVNSAAAITRSEPIQ